MLLRSLLALSLLLVTALLVPARAMPTHAQAPAPTFATFSPVPVSSNAKLPSIAATGDMVHLGSNANLLDAMYWVKRDTDPSFGAPYRLGVAEGQPDYSPVVLARGPADELAYVWVNQPERSIYLRFRAPDGTWGSQRTVARGQPFAVDPAVVITSAGRIVVAWRNPDQPFLWTASDDGGMTWSGATALSADAAVGTPSLAAGPSGEIVAAYTGAEADLLQIYVARWQNGSVTRTRITSLAGDFAGPTATVTPDGTAVVAWRGVADSGPLSGAFVTTQQPDGSFPVSRLIAGNVGGRVVVTADAVGAVHATWIGPVDGGWAPWYAVKPAGGAWASLTSAPQLDGSLFNLTAATSLAADGRIMLHVVGEVFTTSGLSLRYYRFASGLTGHVVPRPVSARPVINDGAHVTRDAEVTVQFVDRNGDPTMVRTRWGSPPTDADPWQSLPTEGLPLRVPMPVPMSTPDCVPLTLSTQVQRGETVQTEPAQATIRSDRAVQARVEVRPNEVAAPGWTQNPVFPVWVFDTGECAGSPLTFDDGSQATPMPTLPFRSVVFFDDPFRQGEHTRVVTLTDHLGNQQTYPLRLTLDSVRPEGDYATATVSVTVDPTNTLSHTLMLQGIGYRDDTGRLPWGAMIAISPTPFADRSDPTVWVIVPLTQVAWDTPAEDLPPGAMPTVTAKIALTIPDSLFPRHAWAPGTYHYGVLLADHAGNVTPTAALGFAHGDLTLTEVVMPTLYLPMIGR